MQVKDKLTVGKKQKNIWKDQGQDILYNDCT